MQHQQNQPILTREQAEYYDGYYRGRIDELRESISDLKAILELQEFEDFHEII